MSRQVHGLLLDVHSERCFFLIALSRQVHFFWIALSLQVHGLLLDVHFLVQFFMLQGLGYRLRIRPVVSAHRGGSCQKSVSLVVSTRMALQTLNVFSSSYSHLQAGLFSSMLPSSCSCLGKFTAHVLVLLRDVVPGLVTVSAVTVG